MTTTNNPNGGGRDTGRDPVDAIQDIERSYSLNRSNALILMNEALARARMLEASQARTRAGATRPARLIALSALKRRERL